MQLSYIECIYRLKEELFYMKKICINLFTLFMCLTTITFTSCDDDGYDLGKFVVSLATVNPIDEQHGTYYLTMDDGTTLWPAASNVYYRPKNDQRVIVNFTLLSDSLTGYDHYVKINALQEILTKKVVDLTLENEAEIGNDPVKILDLWVGDNYLNIHYGINVGGDQMHTLNLVQNKIDAETEGNAIVLELRHNANDDPQRYGSNGYVAFDLKKFQEGDLESVDFIIKNLDFNEETKEYKITYKYKNVDEHLIHPKAIKDMPDHTIVN